LAFVPLTADKPQLVVRRISQNRLRNSWGLILVPEPIGGGELAILIRRQRCSRPSGSTIRNAMMISPMAISRKNVMLAAAADDDHGQEVTRSRLGNPHCD
jgi:hypothetical protein